MSVDPREEQLREQAHAVLESRNTIQTTNLDGTPLAAHRVVWHRGPRTSSDYAAEDAAVAAGELDAMTVFFDRRNEGAREKLIFDAETLVWQRLLDACGASAGVDRGKACDLLARVHRERVRYKNSGFNAALRPVLSPGLPPIFERVVISPDEPS